MDSQVGGGPAVFFKQRHSSRPISYFEGEVLNDLSRQYELSEHLHSANLESRADATRQVIRSQAESAERVSGDLVRLGVMTSERIEQMTEATENALARTSSNIVQGMLGIENTIQNEGRGVQEALGAVSDKLWDIDASLRRGFGELESATTNGFMTLTSAVNHGFSRLQQQTTRLIDIQSEILKTLQNPLTVQADEKSRLGLQGFANQWWDESKKYFDQAMEIYPYASINWLYRGRIAFIHDKSIADADRFIEQALRFSLNHSDIIHADALALQSDVFIAKDDFASAYRAMLRSLGFHPSARTAIRCVKLALAQSGDQAAEALELAKIAVGLQPQSHIALVDEWANQISEPLAHWARNLRDDDIAKLRVNLMSLRETTREFPIDEVGGPNPSMEAADRWIEMATRSTVDYAVDRPNFATMMKDFAGGFVKTFQARQAVWKSDRDRELAAKRKQVEEELAALETEATKAVAKLASANEAAAKKIADESNAKLNAMKEREAAARSQANRNESQTVDTRKQASSSISVLFASFVVGVVVLVLISIALGTVGALALWILGQPGELLNTAFQYLAWGFGIILALQIVNLIYRLVADSSKNKALRNEAEKKRQEALAMEKLRTEQREQLQGNYNKERERLDSEVESERLRLAASRETLRAVRQSTIDEIVGAIQTTSAKAVGVVEKLQALPLPSPQTGFDQHLVMSAPYLKRLRSS